MVVLDGEYANLHCRGIDVDMAANLQPRLSPKSFHQSGASVVVQSMSYRHYPKKLYPAHHIIT